MLSFSIFCDLYKGFDRELARMNTSNLTLHTMIFQNFTGPFLSDLGSINCVCIDYEITLRLVT
jgi:hypothetical protein